jgi:predicted esterase
MLPPPVTPPAEIAPASDGTIGAWLVAGPFDRSRLPDEVGLSPSLDVIAVPGAPGSPRWRLATASDGPIDLAASLDAHGKDRLAYAAGVLHVERGGYHTLLVGADDGVAVFVDGKRIFARDEPRTRRDDEDLTGVDLEAGDHPVVLALLHHGGAWTFRARVLDPELEPPRGASWMLPGTGPSDAQSMAARMSLVSFDRGMNDLGYRGGLTVFYPSGAPLHVPLDVRARLVATASPQTSGAVNGPPVFDVNAGQVAVGDRGPLPLKVALPQVAASEVEDGDWAIHVEIAGRSLDLPFHPRRAVREAVARAGRALDVARGAGATATWLDPTSAASVEHLRDRLAGYVAKGDGDTEAELDDARELDDVCAALEDRRDPYLGAPSRGDGAAPWRTGAVRRAYRSPVDGRLTEFAVYVPPGFDPGRSYPLLVALHGMNGRPLEMIMWLFGHDDPARDGDWEDRHPLRDLPPLQAIVVAPSGHFNTMYRDLGEDDVMRTIDWAVATYPIDRSRITITGPSMGGIGSAACALHHPGTFAAAAPLCGYHSYFVRGDIGGRGLRPWERFIAEERSNVFWAENGLYLPLYVVHGTRDLPEENSGVLIDRYEELHYPVTHEHPDLGHNVWQTTYEDLKGAHWLLRHSRPLHPRAVRFKTPSTRYADDAWVHVRELGSSGAWGEVIARIDKDNVIFVSTTGVSGLALDRDAERIDDAEPVTVVIDRCRLSFQAGEPIELHRASSGPWTAGPAAHEGLFKHGTVTGPLRDVFHEPALFVWGAGDPAQARANEEVARAWARVHAGVRVEYPVMSDAEFFARGESVANDRALFLVGNAASNRVVRELEPRLPIRIEGSDIVVGETRIASPDGARGQLGAAFIRPNPLRPDRYVVVIEGVGPLGTWRSLSLPDMLPDYVVYDEAVTPAHGQLLLGTGSVKAGGFFDTEWALKD